MNFINFILVNSSTIVSYNLSMNLLNYKQMVTGIKRLAKS